MQIKAQKTAKYPACRFSAIQKTKLHTKYTPTSNKQQPREITTESQQYTQNAKKKFKNTQNAKKRLSQTLTTRQVLFHNKIKKPYKIRLILYYKSYPHKNPCIIILCKYNYIKNKKSKKFLKNEQIKNIQHTEKGLCIHWLLFVPHSATYCNRATYSNY